MATRSASVDVPDEFICPITQTLMSDPYVDTDGNSYEKDAILDWLRRKSVSPMTRNPMSVNSVFPNRTLRSLIENFKLQNPDLILSESNGTDLAETKDDLWAAQEALAVLGRRPLILYAVIDVSGSMQSPCDNRGRDAEGASFSRLDLVKHTLSTIISSLSRYDKICVIEFSTSASVFIRPTPVSEANKATLIANVSKLEPEGQTNIWDGMRVAIDEVVSLQNSLPGGADAAADLNVHIYLLTDGEPTINPPGPIDTTIQNYIARKCSTIVPTVSTFGYGSQLDSAMLLNIASIASDPRRTPSAAGSSVASRRTGTFGFIPDASMVGTVFINALANSLRADTCATGRFLSSAPYLASFYDTLVHSLTQVVQQNATHEQRSNVLAFLLSQTQRTLEMHAQEAPRNGASDEDNRLARAFLQGLLRDIAPTDDVSLGQVHKAVQSEFVHKWGIHYLRSVLSAFSTRQCINFKDQAMQLFQQSDERLVNERQRIEDIFLALPAPRPSIVQGDYYSSAPAPGGRGGYSAAHASAAAAPVDMSRYYNVSGGCFTGESLVCTPAGLRAVSGLRPGDRVLGSAGSVVEVEAVLCLPYAGPVYQVGDSMTLTAYHPICVAGRDFFPCELVGNAQWPAREMQHRGDVFDVLLRERGLMRCPLRKGAGQEGDEVLEVATIAHGCQRPKFAHKFFASEQMALELRAHFTSAAPRKDQDKDQDQDQVWRLSAQDRFVRGADGQVAGLQFAASL